MAVGYNCIIAVVRTCYPREDQHHNVTFSSVSSHSPTVPTSTPGRWRFSTTSSTQHSLSGDSTDLGSFSQSESLQVGLGHRPSLRRSHTAPVLFQWRGVAGVTAPAGWEDRSLSLESLPLLD